MLAFFKARRGLSAASFNCCFQLIMVICKKSFNCIVCGALLKHSTNAGRVVKENGQF